MEKQLPNNWVITEVENISDLIRGVSYKKRDSKSIKSENDYLILRGGNVQDGSIEYSDDEVYVNKTFVKQDQELKKGDVLIVGSTGSKKLIGKAAIVKEDLKEVSFGAFLMLIRPIKSINSKFFDYYFLSDYYRETIRDLAGGININNIRKEYIQNLVFPLPPLKEQERIAQKTDALFAQLDDVKARLETIPELLKNFRQAVLNQAVTGKLTEEWRKGKELLNGKSQLNLLKEKKPIKGKNKWLGSENIESNLGLDSWFSCFLLDVLQLLTDGSHHSPKTTAEGYPYITVRDISWNNTIDIENSKRIGEKDYQVLVKNGCKPEKGDVLFSKDGTVGKVYLMKEDIELVVLSSLAILRPIKEFCSSEYLSVLMMSPFVIEQAIGRKTGTAIRRIVLKHLKEVLLYIPNMYEQNEIVNKVNNLFTKADQIQKRYEALKNSTENLPQAILQKAFKGELVEQLPTDGDAKELLEEIKNLKEKLKPKRKKTKK